MDLVMDLDSAAPFYEMRLARDGYAYKEHQFKDYYGSRFPSMWLAAANIPTTERVPRGLSMARVETSLVKMALAELMPHFPSRAERQSKRSRSAVEVGWTYEGSYGYDEREGQAPRAVRAKSWDEFVRLKELIVEVMRRLAPQLSLDEERLNVSCLLYSPGQCIPWHADRKHIYRNPVFGCILFNSSDSVLEFHQMEPQGKPTGRPLERFLVPEEAGCCFLQQHEARYQWIHGVPELHRGERLSVTWRWFLDDVELEGMKPQRGEEG
ncbi:unnamed protein product [Durusdinium trenchii]|uniref:Uncharacterized protein n=2 Tax=Durusdinium trenchii TaxID=1381693 RepID=A0ABP0IY57_9DINO